MELPAISTTLLPIVTVQHDFTNVIADVQEGTVPQEDFWVSCYKKGETSVHGKVSVSFGTGVERSIGVQLTSRLGVEFVRGASGVYTVSCSDLMISSTRIRLPRQVFREPDRSDGGHSSQINTFDVSSDMTQYAIGYNDGEIRRRPLPSFLSSQNPSPRHHSNSHSSTTIEPITYKPHLSGITSLRYFPSSKVILSASADFALSILDADHNLSSATPEPARVFKGHSRSITDTAIISRGKNILSCAKDGTIRLWDVGGGKQIKMMGSTRYSPINKMSVDSKGAVLHVNGSGGAENELSSSPTPATMDEREVDTGDKLVVCALSSGSFECFDLDSKASVFHSSSNTVQRSLTAIAYNNEDNLIATGSSNGIVCVYDTRQLSIPVHSFQRNESSIEDLSFINSSSPLSTSSAASLVIAAEDGLPYISAFDGDRVEISAELLGGDCDAVRVVRTDANGAVWTAGDEGILRMY